LGRGSPFHLAERPPGSVMAVPRCKGSVKNTRSPNHAGLVSLIKPAVILAVHQPAPNREIKDPLVEFDN